MEIKRIDWIDWAKFIGIILVVFGHTEFNETNLYLRKFIYSFHMPLFFFISGYLFKIKEDNFKGYFINSFKSLLIPYVFFCALALIICPYGSFVALKNNYIQIFIAFILGGGGQPPIVTTTWFLASLFFIRLYAYILLRSRINKYVITIIILLLPFIAYFSPIGLWGAGIFSPFMALPIFMFGYLLKQKKMIDKKRNFYQLFLIFVSSLVILLFCNSVQGIKGVDVSNRFFGEYPYLFYFQAISGIFMVISLCEIISSFVKNTPKLVKTISSGTIVILGLNTPVIWIPAVILKYIFHIEQGVDSSLIPNIIITISIFAILYYPIIWIQKKIPFLIGNRK